MKNLLSHTCKYWKAAWLTAIVVAGCGRATKILGQTRNVNIDSLRKLVDVEKHDTTSINNLLYLTYLQTFVEPEEALGYALEVRREALDIPFEEAYLKTFYMIAKVYNGQDQYEKAKEELDYLVSEPKISEYPELQCDCHKALGNYYRGIRQTDVAIEHYIKAVEIGKVIGDFGCHGGCLISIGSLHQNMNNIEKAQYYYNESLAALKGTERYHITSEVYSSLAQVEEDFEGKLVKIDSAIYYGRLAHNNALVSDGYFSMARYLLDEGAVNQAFVNYDSAMIYFTPSAHILGGATIFAELAMVFEERGRSTQGRAYFERGQAIVNELGGHPSNLDYYYYTARYYELIHNYKESLEFQKSYTTLLDSVADESLINAIIDSDTRYETEKRELEIERQELLIDRQANTRNFLIGGSIGVIGLISALFFGLYQRTIRKRQQADLELQLEKERAEDLQRVSKVKTDFFNNVSHELRTPLTLVIAPLEDALKKIKHVQIKKELNMALSNSRRLLNLTNEILDLSRIDEAELSLDKSEVHLKSFLNRVFHSFDSLAQTRDITLAEEVEVPDDLTISTDANKLEKILTNLIANAIKYSEDATEVKLILNAVRLENGYLEIKVKDRGRGIPKEEQVHIFDRFFQSGKVSQSSGTGIGLALVKELAEVLEGEISLESEEGKGSEFVVTIPVELGRIESGHNLNGEQDEVETTLSPIFISGEQPSILIVEDDLEMSKYLVSLLKDRYRCDTAYNGLQALGMVNSKKYDLISSDIMMPEMDGFEFRERLSEIDGYRDTPFIMLSARVLEEDKLRGFQLGIDDYITKPFSSAEYKARVYNLIKNKVSRSQIEEPTTEDSIVERARDIVIDHLDDATFKVSDLAGQLHYSSRQLGRILQKQTGLTPVAFILEIRLEKAYQMIRDKKFITIKEVQYAVGIESASYFSSKFQERFGLAPSMLSA